MKLLRLATRKSPLALWQAEHEAAALRTYWPGLTVELVPLSTQGDQRLDSSLARIGGKGLFVKELEQALLEGHADCAVHSLKDVPVELPPGLELGVYLEREDPYDAWVSNRYPQLTDAPNGARIGSASLRRQCQLRAWRPDLRVEVLRGNVNTRLKKLDANEYDGIILAAAGLRRLGFAARIAQVLAPELSLPAIGQGVLAIECREGDTAVLTLLTPLHHDATASCVAAERAFNLRLGGGCQAPVAAFAQWQGKHLRLQGLVGAVDGRRMLRAEQIGAGTTPAALGKELADTLLRQGAAALLAHCSEAEL